MMQKQKRATRNGSQKLQERACEIVMDGIILDLGLGRYRVSSQSELKKFYDVTLTVDNCWKCSCPYHVNRKGAACKHIMAVQKLVEHIKTRLQKNTDKDAIEISDTVEVTCDRCGSKNCKIREIRKKK